MKFILRLLAEINQKGECREKIEEFMGSFPAVEFFRGGDEEKGYLQWLVLIPNFDLLNELRLLLFNQAGKLSFDYLLLPEDKLNTMPKLAVFDMDSTLIEMEVIDEIAEIAGKGGEVKRITSQAMAGEMDFDESLQKRVQALAGLKARVVEEIQARLPLMKGAGQLFAWLRANNCHTAILSGGFSPFVEEVARKLGIDETCANTLEIHAGKLTGKVVPPIVNAAYKCEKMLKIAEKNKIEKGEIMAIGDGANDALMLAHAGISVAFSPKSKKLAEAACVSGNTNYGLSAVVYLLGGKPPL